MAPPGAARTARPCAGARGAAVFLIPTALLAICPSPRRPSAAAVAPGLAGLDRAGQARRPARTACNLGWNPFDWFAQANTSTGSLEQGFSITEENLEVDDPVDEADTVLAPAKAAAGARPLGGVRKGFGDVKKPAWDRLAQALEDAVLQDVIFDHHVENFGEGMKQLQIELPSSSRSTSRAVRISLVGVNHIGRKAAKLAGEWVKCLKPTALLLELCPERLDFLIRGNELRGPKPKDMFEESIDVFRRAYAAYGDEDREALKAFQTIPSGACGKLLILGDMTSSNKTALEVKLGVDKMAEEVREARDANIARNILAAAACGHSRIVAILGLNNLEGVSRELRGHGAKVVFNTEVGYEEEEQAFDGRGCAAFDGLLLEGSFMVEAGIEEVMSQKEQLLRKFGPKKVSKLLQKRHCGQELRDKDVELLSELRKRVARAEARLLEPRFMYTPTSVRDLRGWHQRQRPRPRKPAA